MFALTRLPMDPSFSRYFPLGRALALSLVLHAALLASGLRLPAPSARAPGAALKVRLVEPPDSVPPAAPATQPELFRPEDTPRKAAVPRLQKILPIVPRAAQDRELLAALQPAPAATNSRTLGGEAARKAAEQVARELFYPPEAIAQGLEGETLVLLFLDEAGNAIAARVEVSSGHPILDAAALHAARTLRSLPASAPREALLPVRFRLR